MSLDDGVVDKGTSHREGRNETPNINTAKSISEIEQCLKELHVHHATATTSLETAISTHEELSRHLRRLDLSRARLSSLTVTARATSSTMLSGPAVTAGRISTAVSRLDLEQARVRSTLEVVEQVAELKSCVLGVMGNMGAPQDWETAAEYLHRAIRIPAHVIESGFAEQVVPTSEVPDAPRVTLDAAAASLCGLFLREFEKAVGEADGGKITRFFKMFPLIGREKEGLEAYGRYVCQGVAQRARVRLQTGPGGGHREGPFYTNAFTKLFEHIAQVIDGHSGLVERHYGEGTMVQVIERLHWEADKQGGIVLETWSDERTIDRKLTDVKSYPYSFLVQSFLPSQKSFSGTPRTQSPAPGGSANGIGGQADENVDMKEVDRVLSEAGTMLGHWSLYLRFVASSAQSSEDGAANGTEHKPLTAPDFVRNSTLPKKISKTLVDPFNTFATFFVRRSVERAFQLDEVPSGLTLNLSKSISANPPYITSAVDDVMYVVNQILQRALATSQSDIVISITTTVGRVIGNDFIGMEQRKMRDESYPKATVQGALPPDDKVLAFLVLINNLDVATDYVKRIVRSHVEDDASDAKARDQRSLRPLEELFPLGRDALNVRNALRNLEGGFSAKATELINDGLSVVFQQVLKPRMRPMLVDAFRDTDYAEEEPSHLEYEEDTDGTSVKARIGPAWEALVKPMKRIMTERLSERLTSTTINHLASLLERRIWSYYGRITEVGAVGLERDIADVVNAASKGENFRLRETFNRCTQIVTIMNLEDDEWEVVQQAENADSEWILDDKERVRARTIVKGRD